MVDYDTKINVAKLLYNGLFTEGEVLASVDTKKSFS